MPLLLWRPCNGTLLEEIGCSNNNNLCYSSFKTETQCIPKPYTGSCMKHIKSESMLSVHVHVAGNGVLGFALRGWEPGVWDLSFSGLEFGV